MKPETVPIQLALNGLVKDIEPTALVQASPNMKNMIVCKSKVRKRLGYSQVGLNLPLAGTGMDLIQYVDARGIVHQLALTTTSIYEYDPSQDQWILAMPDSQLQDCETFTEWTGGNNITLSSASGKEGTYCLKIEGIDMGHNTETDAIAYTTVFDDTNDVSSYGADSVLSFWFYTNVAGLQFRVKLKQAGASVEVITDVAPNAYTWYYVHGVVNLSGFTSMTDIEVYCQMDLERFAYVYIDDIRVCASFNGSTSHRWSHDVAYDSTVFASNGGSGLVVSNCVDKLQSFEGQSGDYFQELDISTSFPDFAHTKEISSFRNHLFLINYNDTYQNVRNIAISDFADVIDYSGGNSDLVTLTDSRGELLRALKLGPDLILYSDYTITTCRYLGGVTLYSFPTLVYETGLFAPKAVWASVNMHYFLGCNQKIYGYAGGQHLFAIGEAVEDSMFNEMNVSKKEHIVVGFDSPSHKLHFFFPEASDDYAKGSYALNTKLSTKPWEYHRFAHTIMGFGIFTTSFDLYADDSMYGGLHADDVYFYADFSLGQSGYPRSTFISDDGYVFQLDEITGKDDTSDIECVYDTPDITVEKEEQYFRLSWFCFNAKSVFASSTVELYYSTNDGKDWTQIDDDGVTDLPISGGLAGLWTQHRIPVDINARKVRFRFLQNSSKDLQLRSFNCQGLICTTM